MFERRHTTPVLVCCSSQMYVSSHCMCGTDNTASTQYEDYVSDVGVVSMCLHCTQAMQLNLGEGGKREVAATGWRLSEQCIARPNVLTGGTLQLLTREGFWGNTFGSVFVVRFVGANWILANRSRRSMRYSFTVCGTGMSLRESRMSRMLPPPLIVFSCIAWKYCCTPEGEGGVGSGSEEDLQV